jgi:hypothetical protein
VLVRGPEEQAQVLALLQSRGMPGFGITVGGAEGGEGSSLHPPSKVRPSGATDAHLPAAKSAREARLCPY